MPLKTPILLLALALAACEPPASPFGTEPVPEPVIFAPGSISSHERDYGIAFSPDGTEAYFTRRGPGRRSLPEIFVSRFVDGSWTEAAPAPFSRGWEESPFLTPDGQRLLFSARQDPPGWDPGRPSFNLWMVERTGDGWSKPMPLPGDVNRPRLDEDNSPARSESGPVLLRDGTLLYWTTEDTDRGADLYVADQEDGVFFDPRPMRLNSGGSESNPAMSPDGRFLLFQGFRDLDAIGEQDLYVSERTDYGWGEPRLLAEPINSARNDGYPSFSPDGRFFFFASDRYAPEGDWSIYYVDTEALGLDIQLP